MKTKNYSLKILSMAISLMMLLSVASIPAMAELSLGNAYTKTGIVDGYTTGNGLSLNAFKTLYSNAEYAAVETFEDATSGAFEPTKIQKNYVYTAKIKLYPIIGEEGTPVTGEGNYCKLELDKSTASFATIGRVDNTEETWHTFSSGNNALRITNINQGLTFSIGEIANNPDLKPVAFGWALTAGGSEFTFSTNVTYSNGATETIETSLKKNTDPTTPDQTKFVGFKAPEGTYIKDINIPTPASNSRAAIVDDIAIIFDEVAGPAAPESITVNAAEETVAEPQYNASKTVQFSAVDQNGSATAVKWSVKEGVGATIDEEDGLLTLKRTEDTSISGTVTVVATSEIDESVTGEKTITVTAADAYFESSKMSDGAVTSYTKNDFVADLNAAEHKTVINFENSAEYTVGSGNIAFSPAVSGNGGTFGCTLQAYKTDSEKDTSVTPNVKTGYIRLQARNTKDNIGYYAIELNTENLTASSIKPTAVGLMLGNSGGNHNCFVRIYLDGESNPIAYSKAFSDANKNDFVGYKAPGGRYIERIELETAASSDFDDLCFIFEDPSAAPIKFSTDAAATNIIGSLADVTGDIYINVAANAFSGKKVLLALYGVDELLDVAMVDASETEAVKTMASIPAGKTLTTVKAFVWNFNGLVPSQNDIIIDK